MIFVVLLYMGYRYKRLELLSRELFAVGCALLGPRFKGKVVWQRVPLSMHVHRD